MIAVYVNEEGTSASLDEKGSVRVYEKDGGAWNVIREIPFDMDTVKGIAVIRRTMIEMVQQLKGCNVFAAKEVIGQLYYVLEANGFESFEAEGIPEEFLSSIQETIDQTAFDKVDTDKPEQVSYFEKTEKDGYYFLNLKKALNLECSLSSKKLLLPFLRQKNFKGLEIFCDHIPRWMETELKALGLVAEIHQLKENEYKVSIITS
jgi:Fe-only nitrogenase accessory protein AnfO